MERDTSHIHQLIATLRMAVPDITAEELMDGLWLAQRMQEAAQKHAATAAATTDQSQSASNDDALAQNMGRDKFGRDERGPDMRSKAGIDQDESLGMLQGQEQEQDPSVGVHTHWQASSGNESGSDRSSGYAALPIKIPAAQALPDKRLLSRSLRPLMRRVPMHRRLVLDVEATVQEMARYDDNDDLWMPVLRPARSRWLDLVLVVDQAASMVVWQQTISELRQLLERQGAFRSVSMWGLIANDGENATLYRGTGAHTQQQRPRNKYELLDPSGRRLILVLSDCVARSWHTGVVTHKLLAPWGKTCPVAIVQMLPQQLWVRTALGARSTVQIQAQAPGLPNTHLQVKTLRSPFYQRPETNQLPMPIITLEPLSLATWARVLAGAVGVATPGRLLPTNPQAYAGQPMPGQATQDATPPSSPPSSPVYGGKSDVTPLRAGGTGGAFAPSGSDSKKPTAPTPEQRVQRFRANTSLLAQELAGLLTSVPLSLSVIHLVQRSMLPQTRPIHLAEVFLSGLIERVNPDNTNPIVDTNAPDEVQFQFRDGVRELLLDAVPVPETMQVLKEVSDYICQHMGQTFDFRALLADPTNTTVQDVVIDAKSQPFAELAVDALRRAGHTDLASRLGDKVQAYEKAQTPSRDATASAEDLLRELLAQDVPSAASPAPPSPAVYGGESDVSPLRAEESDVSPLRAGGPGGALFPTTIDEWRDELTYCDTTFGAPRGYWCYVQPGEYRIGGWEKGKESADITLPGFWVAKHPITVAQYRQFMDAGGYDEERWWTPKGWKWKVDRKRTRPHNWGRAPYNSADDQTVSGVTWYEVVAFTNWLTEQLQEGLPEGYCICLPTEAEWEVAAAYDVHGQRRTYPWGEDDPTPERAVYKETGAKAPAQVGFRTDGAAACGAHDMVGNVWEWATSSYKGYPQASGIVVDDFETDNADVPARGGSHYGNRTNVLCAARGRFNPDNVIDYAGFRLVLSPCLRTNVLFSES